MSEHSQQTASTEAGESAHTGHLVDVLSAEAVYKIDDDLIFDSALATLQFSASPTG